MDYERIHKPQIAIISPSKLRMKLLPPHLHRKRSGSTGFSGAESSEVPKADTSIRHIKDVHQEEVKSGVKKTKAEEDNLDYDSNTSSSSFEFQKAGRSPQISIPRSMPSKWNDAEKWILSRNQQQQFQKPPLKNTVRVAPECSSCEKRPLVVFPPLSPRFSSISKASAMETGVKHCIGLPTVGSELKAIEMRDMGTEMTPVESKEPSRTGTPANTITPLQSPSIPSTPRRSEPEQTPLEDCSEDETRIRKEIIELGAHLGKMRITSWEEEEEEGVERVKEKRASVWEDAERCKHLARYRREEIKIQSWEARTKAKLEAEMKGIEAKIEHERAKANAKIMRRIAVVSRKSEERRVGAECRRKRRAEKATAQAEYIRQTGRIPPSVSRFVCCGWS